MAHRRELRITGGEFRGQRMAMVRGLNTRPTSSLIREAMFSMIGKIDGRKILDLYAGTGMLAIEALSRGAKDVTLVEIASGAIRTINSNLLKLNLNGKSCVVRQKSANYLLNTAERFDLIFADPPYRALEECESVVRLSAKVLTVGGILVLEHRSRMIAPDPEGGLTFLKTRIHGDSAFSLYGNE